MYVVYKRPWIWLYVYTVDAPLIATHVFFFLPFGLEGYIATTLFSRVFCRERVNYTQGSISVLYIQREDDGFDLHLI